MEDKTIELLQQERLQIAQDKSKHQERIGEVVLRVEEILLENNFTWKEWGEVIDMFTARMGAIIPNLTLKFIKETYDESTTNLGGGTTQKSGG